MRGEDDFTRVVLEFQKLVSALAVLAPTSALCANLGQGNQEPPDTLSVEKWARECGTTGIANGQGRGIFHAIIGSFARDRARQEKCVTVEEEKKPYSLCRRAPASKSGLEARRGKSHLSRLFAHV
jgi:hypothetical protein